MFSPSSDPSSQNQQRRPLTLSVVFNLKSMLIASLLLAAGTQTATAKITLTFGTYAADKPSEVVRKFRPVLNAIEAGLTQKLGEPVTIRTQITSSYNKAIDALAKGDFDFARFGPASYVKAKALNPAIQLLAMEAVNGSKTFNGIICVRTDSDITNLQQLQGRSFAFGSPMSTIGRFLSQSALKQAGITAAALKHYAYLGRHDKVGTAVANGQFDAGALKESTYQKLRKRGYALRALITFPNVTKPWVARADLPVRLRLALRDVLLGMTDKAALKALKKSGFLPAAESDYDIIRDAMRDAQDFATEKSPAPFIALFGAREQ